jgi:Glycosyl transferase family 2
MTKISALITTYNRRKFVSRAIQSVLVQTVPVGEIIVIDDGSTDGTAEAIECEFGQRVRVVRQSNQGVTRARRRAISESSGEWVAFLDSDDEWTPDRNRIFLQAIQRVPPEVAWIFGDSQWVTDTGDGRTQYEKFGLQVAEEVHVFSDPLSVQYPWQLGPLPSSVIRRDALIALDCFSGDLRDSEDRLTGIQFGCRYGAAAVPHTVSNLYRTSDLSTTSLVFSRDSLANPDQRADYYRAGMEAFSLAAHSVGPHPWGELYADAVRGLCKVQAEKGQRFRRLALQQFRYGVSWRSIAFFGAATLGVRGLQLYTRLALATRSVRMPGSDGSGIASNGLQA